MVIGGRQLRSLIVVLVLLILDAQIVARLSVIFLRENIIRFDVAQYFRLILIGMRI